MENEFNKHLLSFESGVNSTQYESYRKHFHRPVIQHIRCARPGCLHRHWQTGTPMKATITVQEFFHNLGIEQAFLGSDQHSFQALAYQAINPWGFVGYQFGEELMMTLGYYKPKRVAVAGESTARPQHYSYLANEQLWSKGTTRRLHQGPYGPLRVTHVNEWQGVFMGKEGVTDFSTLTTPSAQNAILKSSQQFHLAVLLEHFGLSKLQSMIQATPLLSWSGVLAAAHLCGTEGIKRYLEHKHATVDELGTSLDFYLSKFHSLDCDISQLINEL